MLTIQPQPSADADPYAEAMRRLASIRHALRIADRWGGGPAADPADEAGLDTAWAKASPARRRLLERRSEMTMQAAAAGLGALVAARAAGAAPSEEASRAMVDQIRAELDALSTSLLGD